MIQGVEEGIEDCAQVTVYKRGRLCRLEPVTFILLEKSFFKDQLGEFLTNIKFWASSPETGFNLVELDPGICILKVAL